MPITTTLWLALTATAMSTIQQPEASPSADAADPLAVLRPLAGRWEGAIDGSLGTGTGVREYEWILEQQFLLFEHTSVRPPQEKSPEGDHHRELAVFSYDSEREVIVLREFMVEGVVTRYDCELEGHRLTCTSVHVESGPGIQGVLTLEIESPFAFTETFDLSFPGDTAPSVRFDNRWTRTPALR